MDLTWMMTLFRALLGCVGCFCGSELACEPSQQKLHSGFFREQARSYGVSWCVKLSDRSLRNDAVDYLIEHLIKDGFLRESDEKPVQPTPRVLRYDWNESVRPMFPWLFDWHSSGCILMRATPLSSWKPRFIRQWMIIWRPWQNWTWNRKNRMEFLCFRADRSAPYS